METIFYQRMRENGTGSIAGNNLDSGFTDFRYYVRTCVNNNPAKEELFQIKGQLSLE